jgi:polyhydroxyalkanoate synthase
VHHGRGQKETDGKAKSLPLNAAISNYPNEKAAHSAEAWLEGAQSHQGGWWADWVEWLMVRSGELVTPHAMGSGEYAPLVAAPGTYVFGK